MSIIVSQVSKRFGDYQALADINLEVKPNTLVALLGPSGSGKSTLLRAIAGLEPPDTGQIIINGQDTTHLDVRKRNIGFVFQHYALFKHLTVRENVAFGLAIRKVSRSRIKERVEQLLDLIQLRGLGDRYPSQLSGGQRQRVALARALASEPQVLLLDEPFGALDAKVRKELRAWLRRLHDEVRVTSVFVTHDQEEAMEVADELVIVNEGRIEQVGSPAEIYENPATSFVMSFMGEVNILPPTTCLLVDGDSIAVESSTAGSVFVRPHELELHPLPNGASTQATVKRVTHLGWEVQLELALPDHSTVIAYLNRNQFTQLSLERNQQIFVKPRNVKFFTEPVGTLSGSHYS
jgi:sulfate transport system ATP-binding protein